MKAVTSVTGDDKYLFFLPLITFCWEKLGVDVICFAPKRLFEDERFKLAWEYCNGHASIYPFKCTENQEITYAQCARLYAAAIPDLNQDEGLISTDIDMAVFSKDLLAKSEAVQLFGADLLEGEPMFPMCYCSCDVSQWWYFMRIGLRTYQECLDDLLKHIDVEHMKGNYWCKDQETLYAKLTESALRLEKHSRAKLPERFATKRIDRDDAYFMERLHPDTIDYHLHRPGTDEQNFKNIMKVFQYFYSENLGWMIEYRNKYVELIKK